MCRLVFASNRCAKISPRMACSVKFFEPMTMRFSRGGPQATVMTNETKMRKVLRTIACEWDVTFLDSTQTVFDPAQRCVDEQRQCGGGDCAHQNDLVVDHAETAENVFPQATSAQRRGNSCESNRDHGSDPNAGNNESQGKRQLDAKQQLTIRHAHTAARFNDRGIYTFDASVRIANQRQQRVKRESQNRETP